MSAKKSVLSTVLNRPLDKLARNLLVKSSFNLNKPFASREEEDKALIRQKGYFPTRS